MDSGEGLNKVWENVTTEVMVLDNTAVQIVLGLAAFFSTKNQFKIELWLKTKNPNFGNVEPVKMINLGRGQKVLDFINNALHEMESKEDGEI